MKPAFSSSYALGEKMQVSLRQMSLLVINLNLQYLFVF